MAPYNSAQAETRQQPPHLANLPPPFPIDSPIPPRRLLPETTGHSPNKKQCHRIFRHPYCQEEGLPRLHNMVTHLITVAYHHTCPYQPLYHTQHRYLPYGDDHRPRLLPAQIGNCFRLILTKAKDIEHRSTITPRFPALTSLDLCNKTGQLATTHRTSK